MATSEVRFKLLKGVSKASSTVGPDLQNCGASGNLHPNHTYFNLRSLPQRPKQCRWAGAALVHSVVGIFSVFDHITGTFMGKFHMCKESEKTFKLPIATKFNCESN